MLIDVLDSTDPYDVEFDAITKHFAIYELEMDGKRTLHRHFLMLPDGAIIEIFDQLSLDLSNQFKSLERLLGDVNMGCGEGRAPAFPKAKKNVSLFAGMEQT
ncbi:unnamed protein product [Symbiodinium microadriaticum]|nr:unnamed protein product [Symbiodinium microadriaticum]